MAAIRAANQPGGAVGPDVDGQIDEMVSDLGITVMVQVDVRRAGRPSLGWKRGAATDVGATGTAASDPCTARAKCAANAG